ncbi:hypothetical protein SANTM175S_03916 [Streptomyces antimycoticus]
MIALQEELDWQVYSLYNLHAEDLRAPRSRRSRNCLGRARLRDRAHRRVEKGEASGEWFKRHNSTSTTELPNHWSDAYKAVVQKRIDVIETSRAIGMVERPEYKRRWATEGWDVLQERALKSWLLDRMENYELDLYEVPRDQRDELAELHAAARERRQPWWARYSDVISAQYERFLGFKAAASTVHEYQIGILPPVRPRRTHRQSLAWAPPRWGQTRSRRLSRCAEHLLEVSTHPSIDLRVVPYERGEQAAQIAAFRILQFSDEDVPDVAFGESVAGSLLWTTRETCAACTDSSGASLMPPSLRRRAASSSLTPGTREAD